MAAAFDQWLGKLTAGRQTHQRHAEARRALPPTLYEYVLDRAFEVDKHPLDFARHRYLIPIYQAFAFQRAHPGEHFNLVLMTAAQVGKSIAAILGLIYAAEWFQGDKFGYFLPDREMADIFSSDRFLPIIQSNPSLAVTLGVNSERGVMRTSTGKKLEDRKRVRQLGESTIFFSYMGGRTSTEAIPMRGVFFDEVRRMYMPDIERASERVSHADYPLDVKISTAGYPDTTIHYFFQRTNQQYFHTACRCPDGIVLSQRFPDCVGERAGRVFFRCPTCDTDIRDPQEGRYVAHAPTNADPGFQISQLLSPVMTPQRIWDKWMQTTDRQEFYNSTLGLPYIDPASILVSLDVAMACVQHALRWQADGVNCVMGVDQRGGENHVVIGAIGAGRKLELRHLEIIQGESPFDRLYALMEQYDVDCCVLDALPSYNEAVRFAKQFRRRVFLSYYSEHVHMLRWADRDQELRALHRAKPEGKFEHHVMLDRYKAIEYALMLWVQRRVACPPPEALTQTVRVRGLTRQSAICLGNPDTGEQGLFWHLRSVARRKIPTLVRDSAEKETISTGQFRMVWEEIGIDPHFLHAFLYCAMASLRKQVSVELILPEAPQMRGAYETVRTAHPTTTPTQAADMAQMHTALRQLPGTQARGGTCGACAHWQPDRGRRCAERGFQVQPEMPACELYQERVQEE